MPFKWRRSRNYQNLVEKVELMDNELDRKKNENIIFPCLYSRKVDKFPFPLCNSICIYLRIYMNMYTDYKRFNAALNKFLLNCFDNAL